MHQSLTGTLRLDHRHCLTMTRWIVRYLPTIRRYLVIMYVKYHRLELQITDFSSASNSSTTAPSIWSSIQYVRAPPHPILHPKRRSHPSNIDLTVAGGRLVGGVEISRRRGSGSFRQLSAVPGGHERSDESLHTTTDSSAHLPWPPPWPRGWVGGRRGGTAGVYGHLEVGGGGG